MTSSNKNAAPYMLGISLVELLVMLFVLTIGIAALVKFQGTYFYYADLSRQQAEAVTLAKQKVESLRHYEIIPTTSGMAAYEDITSGSDTVTQNSVLYTRTWTVTESSNPDYKTVHMQVSWADRRGTTKNIALTTRIGKIDPSQSGVVIQS